MNKKFLKSNIDDISIKLLEEVIEHAYTAGHSSFAPLGCSGDDFILFGLPRRKEITIKLHSGTVKLLVTDNCGQFFVPWWLLQCIIANFIYCSTILRSHSKRKALD
jgi:hypothetical protein